MQRRLIQAVMFMMLAAALAPAPGEVAAAPAPLVLAPQVDMPTRVLFVGNSYDYYGKIDKDTVGFLQQVASDTVKKFYGSGTHQD